jgi:hypothetical protein
MGFFGEMMGGKMSETGREEHPSCQAQGRL